MKLLSGVIAALAIGGSAQAGEWRLVQYDDDAAFAVDVASVRGRGTVKTAWMALVYPVRAHGLDVALMRHEWDCDARTSRVVSRVAYDELGRVLDETNSREPARAVAPDTALHYVLLAVCEEEFEIEDPGGWPDVLSLMRDYRTWRTS